jgi:hypothetical protein
MSTTDGRPDYFRTFRRYVARAVIIFYVFMLVPVGFTLFEALFGSDENVLHDGVRWAVWTVAFVPLTAALVAAIKVYRTSERERSKRLTAWAAGLFLLGIALIAAEAIISDVTHRSVT